MTIKEVAQLAGVSPAAVSRYINGGSISEEKRERVRKAIEETGYRPNPLARTMRTGRINQVGIIVPRIYSDSVSQITAGASRKLFERNFMTVLGCTDHNTETELRYLESMQENQVSGIILMGTVFDGRIEEAIRRCRVPVVITGQDIEGFPCICHDDFHAVKDLTTLLIARGRRKIVMISAPEEDIAAGRNRRCGAEAALREAGLDIPLPLRPVLLKRRGKDSHAEPPPGILTWMPWSAPPIPWPWAPSAPARSRGTSPGTGIVGVGDSWVDNVSIPGLTTAHFFFRQCGEEAAKLLLELIDEGKDAGRVRQTRLQYMIVERGSV